MVPAAERFAASQLAAQVARAELEARPSELRGSLTQARGDKGAGKQQIRGSGGGIKGAGGAPSRRSDCPILAGAYYFPAMNSNYTFKI